MIFYLVLLIISGIAILYSLVQIKNILFIFLQKRAYDLTVRDFLAAYVIYQEIWDKDYDADMILRLSNTDSNIIKFGVLRPMLYKDATELRNCMLIVGEFIIEYSEILLKKYQYIGNEQDYNNSIIILTEIRRIAMQKGEKTNIRIKM